ncbi:MAG: hypothetical protein RL235_629, partial [Chlamydiota bacterium]
MANQVDQLPKGFVLAETYASQRTLFGQDSKGRKITRLANTKVSHVCLPYFSAVAVREIGLDDPKPCDNWQWAYLEFDDRHGERRRVMVNISSAMKRLGYKTRQEVRNACKNGTLFDEAIRSRVSEQLDNNRYVKISRPPILNSQEDDRLFEWISTRVTRFANSCNPKRPKCKVAGKYKNGTLFVDSRGAVIFEMAHYGGKHHRYFALNDEATSIVNVLNFQATRRALSQSGVCNLVNDWEKHKKDGKNYFDYPIPLMGEGGYGSIRPVFDLATGQLSLVAKTPHHGRNREAFLQLPEHPNIAKSTHGSPCRTRTYSPAAVGDAFDIVAARRGLSPEFCLEMFE